MAELVLTKLYANEIAKTGDFQQLAGGAADALSTTISALMDGISNDVILSGLTVVERGTPSMNVDIQPGSAFSVSEELVAYTEDTVGPVAIQASDVQDRIDVVEIKLVKTAFNNEQRAFKDPTTEVISYSDVDTRERVEIQVNVVTGTPGSATAPSATAGWIKIAEVFVGGGVSTILNANIRNVTATLDGNTNSAWTTETSRTFSAMTIPHVKEIIRTVLNEDGTFKNDIIPHQAINWGTGTNQVNATHVPDTAHNVVLQGITNFAPSAGQSVHDNITLLATRLQEAIANDISSLTAAEIDQLQNINTVTITNTQWGYVGNMDQNVATGSTPQFARLGIGQAADGVLPLDVTGNVRFKGNVGLRNSTFEADATSLVIGATGNNFSIITWDDGSGNDNQTWLRTTAGAGSIRTITPKSTVVVGGTKASFYIYTGDSGQASSAGALDDLVIEGSEDVGISLLTPSTHLGRYGFGDATNTFVGGLVYNHTNDNMVMFVAAGTRGTWSSTGLQVHQRLGIGQAPDTNADIAITNVAPRIYFNETGQSNQWAIIVDGNQFSLRRTGVSNTVLSINGAGTFFDMDAALEVNDKITLAGIEPYKTIESIGSSNYTLQLASQGSVLISLDTNNNDTDKAFIVRTDGIDGSGGTQLLRVGEDGVVQVTGGLASSSDSSRLLLAGGSSNNSGANIEMYGSSHPTAANRMYFDAETIYLRGRNATPVYAIFESNSLSFGQDTTIGRNTSDGSDTGFVYLSGGGAAATSRGGSVRVFGNENGTFPGRVHLIPGNSANGLTEVVIYSHDGSAALHTTNHEVIIDKPLVVEPNTTYTIFEDTMSTFTLDTGRWLFSAVGTPAFGQDEIYFATPVLVRISWITTSSSNNRTPHCAYQVVSLWGGKTVGNTSGTGSSSAPSGSTRTVSMYLPAGEYGFAVGVFQADIDNNRDWNGTVRVEVIKGFPIGAHFGDLYSLELDAPVVQDNVFPGAVDEVIHFSSGDIIDPFRLQASQFA